MLANNKDELATILKGEMKVLGLRTQENAKFLAFFECIQKEAESLGKVFFLDFGQCDGTMFRGIEIDRLFGWLVPKEKADAFNRLFLNDNIAEEWDAFGTWVIPEKDGAKLSIKFQ